MCGGNAHGKNPDDQGFSGVLDHTHSKECVEKTTLSGLTVKSLGHTIVKQSDNCSSSRRKRKKQDTDCSVD